MWELYVREPLAKRFALFQDDILAVRNLKAYLEKCPYPKKGYLNLYTFPENARREHQSGWGQSKQRGMGALGLVFDRDALLAVLQCGHLVRKPLDAHNKRSWKAMDGGIVDGMKQFNIYEHVHRPTLLQHVGSDHSVLGNLPGGKPYKGVKGFLGEEYDALKFLEGTTIDESIPKTKTPKKPSDQESLETAMTLVGIDKERVYNWLHSGCQSCDESRRKRAKIQLWTIRVLRGRTEGAEDFLDRILQD
jgi:hypothetical protein